jgi:hypothetical protein
MSEGGLDGRTHPHFGPTHLTTSVSLSRSSKGLSGIAIGPNSTTWEDTTNMCQQFPYLF